MDISVTRHLGHEGCVLGSGEDNLGELFASPFLRKDKNPLAHIRSSKYNADQDRRTGVPESSDVIKG